MQHQPFTMQTPHITQAGYLQGGFHSRQGGGHGHHGPGRLHQQGQHTITRHQHIQSSQKGPNLQPQKQININSQGHKTNRSPKQLQIQKKFIPPLQSPQILWPSQNP